jgi:hypothetical protein
MRWKGSDTHPGADLSPTTSMWSGPSTQATPCASKRSSGTATLETSVISSGAALFVKGTRQDDGTIELGTGSEMRFSPFEAMSQRQEAQITWRQILTASVQRLAFWRR